ncbi:glycosyltransferase family 2 protein [Rhodococcus sp. NPDC003994]
MSISVIMVTYNSAHVVGDSLGPLAESPGLQVVVHDNASRDSTVAQVRASAPTAVVEEGSENVGFARGVNAAVRQATGDVIVLLNPDAVVGAEDLHRLAHRARRDGVIAAPLIRHPDGRVAVVSAGRLPTTWRMATHWFGLSRLPFGRSVLEGHYRLLSSMPPSGVVDVDWVSGACLAVTRETWNALGGLSERWFMYAEDIEFCWRAQRIGVRCVVDTGVVATHLVGASDSSRTGRAGSAWILNLYDFAALRLLRGRPSRVRWGAVVSAGLVVRGLVFVAQGIVDPRRRSDRMQSAADFLGHSRAVARRAARYAAERRDERTSL